MPKNYVTITRACVNVSCWPLGGMPEAKGSTPLGAVSKAYYFARQGRSAAEWSN